MSSFSSNSILYEDRNWLTVVHLSQLANCVTVIGGVLIPLVIWLLHKDKIVSMDAQGKEVVNFQLSCLLYLLLCVPLLLVFLVGMIGMILIVFMMILFPIINAYRAYNGQLTVYPFVIRFIK